MVLIHLIGANPEEHQRLLALGTLEAQIVRVSQQCSSYLRSHRLNPSYRVIGDLRWSQERDPRERHSGACPRALASHGRTRYVVTSTAPCT